MFVCWIRRLFRHPTTTYRRPASSCNNSVMASAIVNVVPR
jgi:hypothetical protein